MSERQSLTMPASTSTVQQNLGETGGTEWHAPPSDPSPLSAPEEEEEGEEEESVAASPLKA